MAHRDLAHDHYGRNLSSMQADIVLEKELSILMSWLIGNRKAIAYIGDNLTGYDGNRAYLERIKAYGL